MFLPLQIVLQMYQPRWKSKRNRLAAVPTCRGIQPWTKAAQSLSTRFTIGSQLQEGCRPIAACGSWKASKGQTNIVSFWVVPRDMKSWLWPGIKGDITTSVKALCYQYLPKKVKIRISSVYTIENAPSKLNFSPNRMVHFIVVCLVAKPLNRSEAKIDFVMI